MCFLGVESFLVFLRRRVGRVFELWERFFLYLGFKGIREGFDYLVFLGGV